MTFTVSLSHMITIIVLLSYASPVVPLPPCIVERSKRKGLEKSKQTQWEIHTERNVVALAALNVVYKQSGILICLHSRL